MCWGSERVKSKSGFSQASAKRVRSAREAALDTLVRVEEGQAYSYLALNQTLEKLKLERPDAALATELVYGTLQRANTIDYFLAPFVSRGLDRLDGWIRCLLRLSFYQLYYLDRIPDHAVVNEAVTIAKRRGHQGISGMVNGVLRSVIRRKEELKLPADLDPARRIALRHSHPQWLVERLIAQFGEQAAERMCASNNQPPHASIRVNRMKYSPDEYMEKLARDGLTARRSPLAEPGLIVEGWGNMAHYPGYANGDYSIQDESSMLVAAVLAAEPGMRVLDCCAAPGGKTTHIAETMNDRGDIRAADIHAHKRNLVDAQAKRLGLGSIRTLTADARCLHERFDPASFDRILLDAPCSGFGIVRRKPDLKWARKEEDVAGIAELQCEILQAVAPLLKPGGVLVYSTCTILDEENRHMISRFLERCPHFVLEPPNEEEKRAWPNGANAGLPAGMIQILPHQFHSDGFFIARMRKQKGISDSL